MKTFLIFFLSACFATSANSQTIKTLGFNTTNGQVIYSGTNTLTFTNNVNFGGGDLSISNQTIAGSGVSFSFEDGAFDYGATIMRESLGFSTNLNALWTATNSSNARSAVGLGSVWLTNTNATNFRTSIQAASATADFEAANKAYAVINNDGGAVVLEYDGNGGDDWVIYNANDFRFSVGLSLPALTNTSNITTMRALSGSTNTNHPYSGSISVVGTNNTNTLVFSNGILQSVQ
jgi:hypothetical protein